MKALLVIIFMALAIPAYAEPVVLAVDGKDIYVDIGAKDGVGAGSELELLHEITARDPRSGATLRDRFALGTITVIKSGAAISVARADESLAKRVLPGDRVRLVSEKRAFVDPWEEQVAASKGQPAPLPGTPTVPTPTPGKAIDHAALAKDAWQDTLGKPLDARITRWTELLTADPQTPYRKAIEQEINNLRYQMQLRDQALAQAKATHTDARDPRIAQLAAQLEVPVEQKQSDLVIDPINRAVPGRPIELAFLMRRPSLIRSAWLYVRADGAPGFSRTELVRDGDSYLRGTIPGEQVHADSVDWYVEVFSTPDGDPMPMVGSQGAPMRIEVDTAVGEAPIEQGRTHIDGHIDYVDFDGKFNDGYDQYTQAELDFTYRFLHPIYAFRVGFGTLTGTGGPASVIDLGDSCLDPSGAYRCERMTFSYVYAEAEFRVRENVALMVRPTGGVLTTDTMPDSASDRCKGSSNTEDCVFFTGFGARGRIRLGTELGTNLVLGASFTARVGTLLEAAYHWLPNPIVPVQITVQVTDQPVVEDFGVRLIADVGVRKLSWFYPSARVSYQARNINHSGFSGGLALNFDW
ncbi:MAG TPA: hypothetical protein VMZ53_18920 [Kofleriaceae bacterium]|nr:hypothetical protein [Kofleriaceae bacterium]